MNPLLKKQQTTTTLAKIILFSLNEDAGKSLATPHTFLSKPLTLLIVPRKAKAIKYSSPKVSGDP
jgi:hypothetical protein